MAAIQRVVVLNERQLRSHFISNFCPLDTIIRSSVFNSINKFPLVVINAIFFKYSCSVLFKKNTPFSHNAVKQSLHRVNNRLSRRQCHPIRVGQCLVTSHVDAIP